MDELTQCEAFNELHGVKMDAAFAADKVDGDDVLMVQAGGGFGFVVKSLQLFLVHCGCEREHLEGYPPAERDLLRLVYHPHAATAHFMQEPEIAERSGTRVVAAQRK